MVRPSLDWLINPVAKEEFFRDYWEQRPLVVRRDQRDYFGTLLSLQDVDRVITTLDRRYPDIVLKNASDPSLSSESYTLPGGVLDVTALYQLFRKGSTISLAFLDTVVPALTLFCRSVEAEFSCPLQTNVYLTPPNAQGAPPHYDTHDVFVLQIAGSKLWTIFGTPVGLPLPSQSFDERVHALGDVTLEFELEAGDMAYIPRGVAHEAKSTDATSLHITTGVLSYTYMDLLSVSVVDAALRSPALRRSLPPGFARTGFDKGQLCEMVRSLLRQAAHEVDADAVRDIFIDKFLNRCPPVLEGQMAQLASLDLVDSETCAGVRPGAIFHLEIVDEFEIIETYGRRIKFPVHTGAPLRFALSHSRFVVKDLPGSLDEGSKITLVRRLIEEGLVMALPPQAQNSTSPDRMQSAL